MKPPNAWIVASALICEDGNILLLEEDRLGQRQLNTPGGRVRPYEHPATAAVRETKEETGLDIRILDIMAIIQGTWPDGANFVRLVFTAECVGGREHPEKEAKVRWTPLARLLDPRQHGLTLLAIEEAALRDFAQRKKPPYVYFYQTTDGLFTPTPVIPE